ncbi:hypothetical protein [Algoriphagus faecimaris]|nr:hypothetical protein [Algoriphagus faecimaris]
MKVESMDSVYSLEFVEKVDSVDNVESMEKSASIMRVSTGYLWGIYGVSRGQSGVIDELSNWGIEEWS